MIILVHQNDWHCLASRMYQAVVHRNSLWQVAHSSCVNKARCATGYLGFHTQSAQDGQGRVTRHTYRLSGIAY